MLACDTPAATLPKFNRNFQRSRVVTVRAPSCDCSRLCSCQLSCSPFAGPELFVAAHELPWLPSYPPRRATVLPWPANGPQRRCLL